MRRQEFGQETRRTLRWALLGSLAAHFLLLPYVAPRIFFAAPDKPGPMRAITNSQQSPALLARREAIRRQMRQLARDPEALAAQRQREEEARRREEAKKNAAAEKPVGQIVLLPPTPDDRAPDDARYSSEYNTRVERETRSRNARLVQENITSELSTARPGKLSSPAAVEQTARALEIGPAREGKDGAHGGSPGPALEIPESRRRDRLALKLDPQLSKLVNREAADEVRGNSDRLKLSLGSGEQDASQPGSAPVQGPAVVDLIPNLGVLARLSGAPFSEHLEDVEEGEGTFLNSREFKFASYFNRMKRGITQYWDPLPEFRRRDPTGNIYGVRSRVTVLQVTLAPDGSLKSVEVRNSSGLDFLDREAVSAFQRAQPFPNPPRALVTDGQIAFPFGFHIDFNSRSGMRLPF